MVQQGCAGCGGALFTRPRSPTVRSLRFTKLRVTIPTGGRRNPDRGIHRLRHSVRGPQRRNSVQTLRRPSPSRLLTACKRKGCILECHCQQRRTGKLLRLVQRPLGNLLANYAARVDGRAGRRRPGSQTRLQRDDGNGQNRHRQNRSRTARLMGFSDGTMVRYCHLLTRRIRRVVRRTLLGVVGGSCCVNIGRSQAWS